MFDGRLVLSIALALASALAFAVATVAQQRAAARASDEAARSARFIVELLRSPQWWAGTLGNGGGFALQALALGFGPLLIVSPIIVTSLLFALPLCARLGHRPMSRADWVWGLLLVAGLAVFVSLGRPDDGVNRASPLGWVVVAVLALPVVVVCLLRARSRSGAARAYLLAVTTGVLAGISALLTKSVVDLVPDGAVALLGAGETYGLVVVGLSGVYVQQLAFQSDGLQSSLPVISVLEPVIAAVLGMTLLHEQIDVNGFGVAVLAVAVVVMVAATLALARGQARMSPPAGAVSPTG